jgi:hypothetical protein
MRLCPGNEIKRDSQCLEISQPGFQAEAQEMETLIGGKGEHAMFGFTIGFWDYITFAALAVIVLGFVLFLILILGLPGRIAIARKHPEADAVKLMGWVGFVAVVPWIQALIWAFKPTDVVDIRRFPREEQMATERDIARLSGKTPEASTAEPDEKTTAGAPDKKDGEES